jgi:hypothetical protein
MSKCNRWTDQSGQQKKATNSGEACLREAVIQVSNKNWRRTNNLCLLEWVSQLLSFLNDRCFIGLRSHPGIPKWVRLCISRIGRRDFRRTVASARN